MRAWVQCVRVCACVQGLPEAKGVQCYTLFGDLGNAPSSYFDVDRSVKEDASRLAFCLRTYTTTPTTRTRARMVPLTAPATAPATLLLSAESPLLPSGEGAGTGTVTGALTGDEAATGAVTGAATGDEAATGGATG